MALEYTPRATVWKSAAIFRYYCIRYTIDIRHSQPFQTREAGTHAVGGIGWIYEVQELISVL
jgi:hypothetical protein